MAKHRRQPPRRDGSGKHRAAPGGLTRTVKRAVVIVMVFAVAATAWVVANNELALRNGTEPTVPIPVFTEVPPTEELPEPTPLGPVLKPPSTTVPVRPESAPDTGGGPEQEGSRSGSAHRPASVPPPEFDRDCLIINLGEDVKPPARDVACFLDEQFSGVTMIWGVGPRAEPGSGHEEGLAVDLFVRDERTAEQVKECAARRFREWNLRNIIHGDLILVAAGGEFRPMEDHEDPGGPEHVHIALKDESAIPAYSLTC